MLTDFYRCRLNGSDRLIYDELCKGIVMHRKDIQVAYTPDIMKILTAVNYDHPEFFYVNWLESIQCVYYPGRMSVHLSMLYSEQEIAAINRKISELSGQIAGISDYGKALGIHDWFVYNIEYDHKGLGQVIRSPGMFSAVGPLFRKKAVCEGVSKLACLLMRRKNVDSAVVTGLSHDGVPHAWNMFCAGGQTVYTDITYDIGYSLKGFPPSRKYFCMTRAEIERDHKFINT